MWLSAARPSRVVDPKISVPQVLAQARRAQAMACHAVTVPAEAFHRFHLECGGAFKIAGRPDLRAITVLHFSLRWIETAHRRHDSSRTST